jgi:hypothetical protein
MRYVIDKHGNTYIAHRDDGHDCVEDESGTLHAESDHPVAALRQLLKKEEG